MNGGKTLLAAGTMPENGATPESAPTILFFDTTSGKLTKTVTHGTNKEGYVHDMVPHPTGCLMAVTSESPGSGMLFLLDPAGPEVFYENKKMANCRHALALHPGGKHFIVTSTNRDSNGNGKTLAKDGTTENLILFSSPVAEVKSFTAPGSGLEGPADRDVEIWIAAIVFAIRAGGIDHHSTIGIMTNPQGFAVIKVVPGLDLLKGLLPGCVTAQPLHSWNLRITRREIS